MLNLATVYSAYISAQYIQGLALYQLNQLKDKYSNSLHLPICDQISPKSHEIPHWGIPLVGNC